MASAARSLSIPCQMAPVSPLIGDNSLCHNAFARFRSFLRPVSLVLFDYLPALVAFRMLLGHRRVPPVFSTAPTKPAAPSNS